MNRLVALTFSFDITISLQQIAKSFKYEDTSHAGVSYCLKPSTRNLSCTSLSSQSLMSFLRIWPNTYLGEGPVGRRISEDCGLHRPAINNIPSKTKSANQRRRRWEVKPRIGGCPDIGRDPYPAEISVMRTAESEKLK